MEIKEKELCLLKDQQLSKMERQCDLLTCLNELRCQQIAICEEKLDVFSLELDHVKVELSNLICALLGHQAELKVLKTKF
jgi:hypothetical protein